MIDVFSEHSMVLEENKGHITSQVLKDKKYKTVTPDFPEIDTHAFIYLLIHLFNKN